jgi:hypothetical protein
LLASFLRAVDLAASLRGADFFCAARFDAARVFPVFFPVFLGFLLAIGALPVSLPRE